MPSEQPSASTVATDPAQTPLFSPRRRWKKPSSGPQPRMGGGHQRGPNASSLGPPSSRSELKRTLRDSAETAGLVLDLNAAKASRGSDSSVRPDGGNDDVERLGPARVALDVGHGAANASPLGPPSIRSELKRTLRDSAETAVLALAVVSVGAGLNSGRSEGVYGSGNTGARRCNQV